MATGYMKRVLTPSVLAAQSAAFGRQYPIPETPAPDVLGPEEAEFISRRDSFYLATNNSDGWPYIQHRGGPVGFLKVLSPNILGFADYKGNRQLLSCGNLVDSPRVSVFLMDYPNRERLKILGLAKVVEGRERVDLWEQCVEGDLRDRVERLFLIEVVGFDWNCPKYITPRYSAAELEAIVGPLRARIAELEGR